MVNKVTAANASSTATITFVPNKGKGKSSVVVSDPNQPVLVHSIEQAQEVLTRLETQKQAVYDCETTGLDWRTDKLVGHVWTLGPRPCDTYYIPVRHGEDHNTGNLHKSAANYFEDQMRRILGTRRDLHLVGHHFQFDLMFLHSLGIDPISTLEDTEVNDALLDEHAASHSLESACHRIGATAKKGDQLYQHLAGKFGGPPERRKQMGNFWRLAGDDPVGFDYAAGDGVSTWDLLTKQRAALEAEELTSIAKLESRVTRVLYRMIRRGTKIDEERLAQVLVYVEKGIEEAARFFPNNFNVNAPSQVQALFEKNDITDWPMTAPTLRFPQGNPSFKEEWLKKTEIGRAILVERKFRHLKESFLIPLRDRHLYKGRVHANFTQMANDEFGTITGRLSSNGPNLQQVHKRNEELGRLFRSIFVPDEGLDWWDADLSQCEPRLLAHYSGSRVLTEGYLSKPSVDAHSSVAKAAGIGREDGKRLNQTLITGGGKKKIIAMLGANGADIYDAYFMAMPEVKRLQREASNRMSARGYVISLLGRRARLQSPDKGYLAINRLLQCGNADIIKKAMADIDDHFESYGDEVSMLNTAHDALAFQADRTNNDHIEQMDEALRLFTDYGPERRSTFLRVPMVADFGIGRNWAEATYPSEKLVYGD